MIDTEHEKIITLADAAKFIPSRPNLSTVWRWRNRGVRGVKLETVLLGGRRMTSREALSRFFAATTAAADGIQVKPQTNRQRAASISEAKSELEAAGI